MRASADVWSASFPRGGTTTLGGGELPSPARRAGGGLVLSLVTMARDGVANSAIDRYTCIAVCLMTDSLS